MFISYNLHIYLLFISKFVHFDLPVLYSYRGALVLFKVAMGRDGAYKLPHTPNLSI